MFVKLLVSLAIIAGVMWWIRQRNVRQPPSGGDALQDPPTLAQAYKILDLPKTCTRAEIISSHRRLMSGLHPDKGGSTYLAQQLNAAKTALLARHPD